MAPQEESLVPATFAPHQCCALHRDGTEQGVSIAKRWRTASRRRLRTSQRHFGQDCLLAQQLPDKVKDSAAMEKDPEGTVKRMIEMVSLLTTSTEEEKLTAKSQIEDFKAPEEVQTDESDESDEHVETTEGVLDQELLALDSDLEDLEGDDAKGDASALVEVSSQLDTNALGGLVLAVLVVGVTVFSVIVLAEALVFALLTYALISVISCGAYYYGKYHGAKAVAEDASTKKEVAEVSKTSFVKGFGKCVFRLLTLPLKPFYYLGKWTYKMMKSSKNTTTPSK